jgi:hypothetical protein
MEPVINLTLIFHWNLLNISKRSSIAFFKLFVLILDLSALICTSLLKIVNMAVVSSVLSFKILIDPGEFVYHLYHCSISYSDGASDPIRPVVGAATTRVLEIFSTSVLVGFTKALYSMWNKA